MNKKKIFIGAAIGLGVALCIGASGLLKGSEGKSIANIQDIPVVYLKGEEYYIKSAKSNEEKLEGVKKVFTIDEDGNLYYLDQEDKLYSYKIGNEKNELKIPEISKFEEMNISKNISGNRVVFDLKHKLQHTLDEDSKVRTSAIFLEEKGELTEISKNGEFIGITENDEILYRENNELLRLNNQGQKIKLSGNVRDVSWDKRYQKLVFSEIVEESEDSKTLSVWDSKDDKIYDIEGLETSLTKYRDFTNIMFLNENQFTFNTSILGVGEIYLATLDGDVKRIEDTRLQSGINDFEDNTKDLSKINNRKKIFYFTKEEKPFEVSSDENFSEVEKLFKERDKSLYSYDIESGNIEKHSEQGNIYIVEAFYNDSIYYRTIDDTLVRLDLESNKETIIDENCEFININEENAYVYSADKLSLNGDIILEGIEKFLDYNTLLDSTYIIKDNKLLCVFNKGKEEEIIIPELDNIKEIYIGESE